jgi:hypothetical protein
MLNINTLFIFLLVLSILYTFRILFIFISALLQTPPGKMVVSSKELVLLLFTVSYIITFIIQS